MIESRVHLFDIGGDWDPGLHTYGFFFFSFTTLYRDDQVDIHIA